MSSTSYKFFNLANTAQKSSTETIHCRAYLRDFSPIKFFVVEFIIKFARIEVKLLEFFHYEFFHHEFIHHEFFVIQFVIIELRSLFTEPTTSNSSSSNLFELSSTCVIVAAQFYLDQSRSSSPNAPI
ncbi:hypothetical protein XPA_006598 [Xanthoria parietina]